MAHLKKPFLTLKEFMLRKQVLKLYRELLRSAGEIPNPQDRLTMKEWIRNDFKVNKNQKDELAIKSLIKYGERSLKELQQSLELTK